MNLKNILDKNRINYKVLDEDDNFNLFKIDDKLLLLYLNNNTSDFVLDRDIFDYIDGNKLVYSILLENRTNSKLFYLQFPNKNNWIKGSFQSCDKQEIHLGKIVLNSQITITEFVTSLKK